MINSDAKALSLKSFREFQIAAADNVEKANAKLQLSKNISELLQAPSNSVTPRKQ